MAIAGEISSLKDTLSIYLLSGIGSDDAKPDAGHVLAVAGDVSEVAMGIAGFLAGRFVRLIGMSADRPTAACIVRPEDLPADDGAAWPEWRLARLESLCVAANAGPCCDSGPLIVAVEAMERQWLAERREKL